jgi:quercetin dioxygenase-like cupin family protein
MVKDGLAGPRTATLRTTLGLSVEELAARSGCDAGLIEQLERGQLAPSLAPLAKIARALGVRLGTLLDDEQKVGPVVTRRDEAHGVTRFRNAGKLGVGTTLEYRALASGKSTRHMEPFLVTISPGKTHEISSHEGEEFIYVLDGRIEVEYGKETYTLVAGDSIYFDSIVAHRVQAAGNAGARVLSTVYAP